MLVAAVLSTLPDAYLLKVDRSSMANAVEVRCPLLDKKLVEALQTIPRKVLMKRGETKSLEKKIAESYLPKAVIYRTKRGFSVPLAAFIKRLKPGLLEQIIDCRNSFSYKYFDTALLKKKIRLMGIGVGNSPYEVNVFRKKYDISFPLFSDADFSIHKLVGEVRTPYFIGIKIMEDGTHNIFYSKRGGIESVDKFLSLMVELSGL